MAGRTSDPGGESSGGRSPASLDRVYEAYLEHLGAGDLQLLADVARRPPAELRARPGLLAALLGQPDVANAVFAGLGVGGMPEGARRPATSSLIAGPGLLVQVSPFLAFAVAIHQAADDLGRASFTEEWVGLRRRIPVFDVGVLVDFVGDPLRRLFLAELLASYTRLASGVTWERGPRGWRRRRFSDLDPVRLAELAESADEELRPGVYRRLGDLALFLTGVFPDHTASRGISPIAEIRLRRLGRLGGNAGTEDLPAALGHLGSVGLLEELGRRWYGLATARAAAPLTSTMVVVADLAEHFREARRVLNLVTDRYLFPFRSHLFPNGGG